MLTVCSGLSLLPLVRVIYYRAPCRQPSVSDGGPALMRTKSQITMLTACLALSLLSFVQATPSPCSVLTAPGSLAVDCSCRDLTQVPSLSLIPEVNTLNISFNQIVVLENNSLHEMKQLKELNLRNNALTELQEGAFQGLPALTSVDLSYNRLSQIQPNTFRNLSLLRSLRLSYNQIQWLTADSFVGLVGLCDLILSNNQLRGLSSGLFTMLHSLQHLDLSHNGLQEMNVDSFVGLDALEHLQLDNNDMAVLKNFTFRPLRSLTTLSLTSNRLVSLQVEAFWGLHNLATLDLSRNSLDMTSLPPGVFAPLGGLRELRLEYNIADTRGDYREGVFCHLVSLRRLSIDTFSEMHFGMDFSSLVHLQTLDLSHHCGVDYLRNSSLEGFHNSSLAELFFDHCTLLESEACAFCHLPRLRVLRITNSPTLPLTVLRLMYGLQGLTMREIKLDYIGSHLPLYSTLDRQVASYLRNVCVARFQLTNSNIGRVAGSAMVSGNSSFSRCIEDVDLSSNSVRGDTSFFIKLFLHSPRLHSLSLQNQATFTLGRARCLASGDPQCKSHLVNRPRPLLQSLMIPIPYNMTYLNLSSVFPHLNPLPPNITFVNARSMQTLDLSYIGLATCRFTLYGLGNLTTLRLEGNICTNFTDTAFDELPRLRSLILASMVLEPIFLVSTHARRVFQNLKDIRLLDLSSNNIRQLVPDMLQVQGDLRELRLANNRLQAVPVDLRHHGRLRRLDLGRNMTSLTAQERTYMDHLATDHPFSLHLYGNPLTCSCFNLDLIPWLFVTPVTLDGEGRAGNFTCSTEAGQLTSTERVMDQWLEHWRACVGGRIFTIALVAFAVQILGLVIAVLVVRSWTQLYYAWHALKTLHLLPRRTQFPKDAYLVYADVDSDVDLACVTLRRSLEGHYDVKLLLPNRDGGMEGGGMGVSLENVLRYIDSSWKVVLLVTQAFSSGPHSCDFAVTHAQRSITPNMPNRVIVVFFEDPIHLPKMPSLTALLRMVPEKNVLYIRPDTPIHHPVWKVVADMILDDPGSNGKT